MSLAMSLERCSAADADVYGYMYNTARDISSSGVYACNDHDVCLWLYFCYRANTLCLSHSIVPT